MHRFAYLAFASAVAAAFSATAPAALIVHVTDGQARPGGVVTVDAYITTDDTVTDTRAVRINSYSIGVFVDRSTPVPATAGFAQAARTDLGFGNDRPMFLSAGEFSDLGDYRESESDFGPGQSRLGFNALADADAGEALSNVNGLGLARFVFGIPDNATVGTTYSIVIDPDATSFATPGDDSRLVDFTAAMAGTITVVPEPASLALLVLPAVSCLRRRRRHVAVGVSRFV